MDIYYCARVRASDGRERLLRPACFRPIGRLQRAVQQALDPDESGGRLRDAWDEEGQRHYEQCLYFEQSDCRLMLIDGSRREMLPPDGGEPVRSAHSGNVKTMIGYVFSLLAK